ncbi:hypothetical protein RB195_024282 [Necator americanus]|uniref:Uncharacterized protein n=1 Tax=Necator americanus TaxID=51031 RepID=A0ABR1EPV7_NECAM
MKGFKKLIPRFLSMKYQQTSLITFANASKGTIAACVYLHSGKFTSLLLAKEKLPSLKHDVTTPKIELNAMTLAMRITNAVLARNRLKEISKNVTRIEAGGTQVFFCHIPSQGRV